MMGPGGMGHGAMQGQGRDQGMMGGQGSMSAPCAKNMPDRSGQIEQRMDMMQNQKEMLKTMRDMGVEQ